MTHILPAIHDPQHQARNPEDSASSADKEPLDTDIASLEKLPIVRIDSTVVASHTAPPSDSQWLNRSFLGRILRGLGYERCCT